MNILFIIIMMLFSVVVFGLPIWNLARLQGRAHSLFWIVPPVLMLVLFYLGNILNSESTVLLYKIFRDASFIVLIVGMMIFSLSVIFMLAQLAFRFSKKTTFWLIVCSTILYITIAVINGQRIIIKDIELPALNITREYNFVHITDLHNGSTNRAHAQKVVDMIIPLNPEFVVITGDFIDEFFVETYDIEPFNDIDVPIYLITGNHEYYLEPGRINEIINGTKITLIDSMKIPFGELDIIGVDEVKTIQGTLGLLGGVDKDRYTILLDHQPKEKEVLIAEQSGIALMLSGHTHKGQIWPLGLLLKLRFMYIGGLYEIGNMFLYVNQGTGTLGPQLRVGTVNEITNINLVPSE